MSAISKILRLIVNNGNTGLMFHCPGCKEQHSIYYEGPHPSPKWEWNRDANKPTIKPSIKVTGNRILTKEELDRVMKGEDLREQTKMVCHSFITDGKIQFLDDCTHELKGQTVNLPEWTKLD